MSVRRPCVRASVRPLFSQVFAFLIIRMHPRLPTDVPRDHIGGINTKPEKCIRMDKMEKWNRVDKMEKWNRPVIFSYFLLFISFHALASMYETVNNPSDRPQGKCNAK